MKPWPPRGGGYALDGSRRSHWRTSPSSEQVRKRNGEDSVTMRFTLSTWLRYNLALVLPSLRYRVPLKNSLKRRLRVEAANAEVAASFLLPVEYSISKTRTCESPAHVTRVPSFECGINLTEKMLALWPVKTVVLSANGASEESGW